MASTYPGSLDAFDSIASDKKTSDTVGGRTHRDMHNDLGDAVEAVQGELGTNPSGSESTVAARLTAIEAGTRMGAGSISTSQLAAGAVTAAKLAVAPGNLLTDNQASIETSTAGWSVDGGVTLSREAAPTSHGSYSLLATCTGTGAAQFSSAEARVPVTAGDTLTFQFRAHGGVGTRNVQAMMLFYDAASSGTLIGGDSVKGTAVTTDGSWQTAWLTTVVPAGATHVVASTGLQAGSNGDAVYFDRFGLWIGAGGTWRMPGVFIPHLGIRPNPSNTAEVQIWNDATAAWVTV